MGVANSDDASWWTPRRLFVQIHPTHARRSGAQNARAISGRNINHISWASACIFKVAGRPCHPPRNFDLLSAPSLPTKPLGNSCNSRGRLPNPSLASILVHGRRIGSKIGVQSTWGARLGHGWAGPTQRRNRQCLAIDVGSSRAENDATLTRPIQLRHGQLKRQRVQRRVERT